MLSICSGGGHHYARSRKIIFSCFKINGLPVFFDVGPIHYIGVLMGENSLFPCNLLVLDQVKNGDLGDCDQMSELCPGV